MGMSLMANLVQPQAVAPETLKKQLSVAVRSIQWNYAIFWSLSTTQQGVLQWGNGYHNGDIKTRKTVQAMELKVDKIGLQRSKQLRELYEFLLEGEIDQNKRPSAALSPEDLSDAEWYYLVCMSFVFNLGQGLPGRALANGETIWLCNAHDVDSEVFSRSLLAKSASIQTVVCFPYLGGVIELGVNKLVPEDPNLLQHIKASFLDMTKPICFNKSPSLPCNANDDRDPSCANFNQDIVETPELDNLHSPTEEINKFDPEEGIGDLHRNIHEECSIGLLDECSNGCEHNHQTEDSLMLEELNGVASQVQNWHFMDDDCKYGAHNTINSSDCITRAFANEEKAPISSPNCLSINHFHTKLSSLDLGADDDLHYKKTLSVNLKCSSPLSEIRSLHAHGHKSGFVRCEKEGIDNGCRPGVPQNILKNIPFAVPLLHGGISSTRFRKETGKKHFHKKLENDNLRANEKFLVLKLMVASTGEVDKASILNDIIKYLKELEARVEELESCMDSVDCEVKPRRDYLVVVEQTSDNYKNRMADNAKKSCINKRKKASDIHESYETNTELNTVVLKDGLISDLKVSIKEQDFMIEMKCPFREYIFQDIMDAINNLYLDANTVQSFTLDGILMLHLKSEFRGKAIALVRMIKQALQKVASKC